MQFQGDKTDVTALVKYAQSLEAENARLRADLKMIQLKAENAKGNAIKARDSADLAVQYIIDCERLVVRALEPGDA